MLSVAVQQLLSCILRRRFCFSTLVNILLNFGIYSAEDGFDFFGNDLFVNTAVCVLPAQVLNKATSKMRVFEVGLKIFTLVMHRAWTPAFAGAGPLPSKNCLRAFWSTAVAGFSSQVLDVSKIRLRPASNSAWLISAATWKWELLLNIVFNGRRHARGWI